MEGSDGKRLLTVSELASLLQVPASWVYSRTRLKGPGQIPTVRIGKYCRFDAASVFAWLKAQVVEAEEGHESRVR